MLFSFVLGLDTPVTVINYGISQRVTQCVAEGWQRLGGAVQVVSGLEGVSPFKNAIDQINKPCLIVSDTLPLFTGATWIERFNQQKSQFAQEGLVALGASQRYLFGLGWPNRHRKAAAGRLREKGVEVYQDGVSKPLDTSVLYVDPDSERFKAFKRNLETCEQGKEWADLEVTVRCSFGIPIYRPYEEGLPALGEDGRIIIPDGKELMTLSCLRLDPENPRIPVFSGSWDLFGLRSWRQARSSQLDERNFKSESLIPLSRFC